MPTERWTVGAKNPKTGFVFPLGFAACTNWEVPETVTRIEYDSPGFMSLSREQAEHFGKGVQAELKHMQIVALPLDEAEKSYEAWANEVA